MQAKAELSKLDQPLAWLGEAKRSYGAIKDYACTLVSEENVRGKMQDQNIMQPARRRRCPASTVPLAPKQTKNQEVAFVLGKNNNKMRVKSNFIGSKIIGFLSIDPKDPRVMEHSRHTILEAGIGNMIDQNIRHWERERLVGKTDVRISESAYNERKCYRVEVINLERRPDSYCYRSVLYLEQNSKLPIRVEVYDWPRQGGPAEGDLLERFSYVNIQFNTGMTEREFEKWISFTTSSFSSGPQVAFSSPSLLDVRLEALLRVGVQRGVSHHSAQELRASPSELGTMRSIPG